MYLKIYYFYLLLNFSSKTFIDFIPSQQQIANSEKIININKLNTDQLNKININKDYNDLEKELINEKNKNKILSEKILQLEKELDDERKMVKTLKEKINSSNIQQLQNSLDLKNKEIEELKLKDNPIYNIKSGEQLYSVNFASVDQKIVHYSIIGKNTDKFVRLEEKIYEDYPEYKDEETYFMKNGEKIKRFKTLDENNIKNNDILMLYTIDI